MKAEHEHLSKRFASRESREDRFQQGLKLLHQKWNFGVLWFLSHRFEGFRWNHDRWKNGKN